MVRHVDVKEWTAMAVSVCIPTYKRADLLIECLHSVFESAVRPLEIVVSDDAHDTALADRLAALETPEGIELRYAANHLGRRQAANVRNAFEQARHELVVLMHDDDFFLPGGLDALWRGWREADDGVDAVFGRQRIAAADGTFLPERSARWNAKYHRLQPGLVPSNLWSALVQQFPMNGMMLRRSVALAAGVPPEHEVGHHTDLHFAIRYARTATRPFLLIAEEVSAYRLSAHSIRRSTKSFELDGDLNYATLEAVAPRDALERQGRAHILDVAAGNAVLALLARGEGREARRIFARHWSRMKVPTATRLKLAVLVAGSLFGLRWPEAWIARRRLGLPDPRRLLLRRPQG
jgi:GT2 family glycosyltransferase